ncbi:MAG: DinB family protein, partial [Thermoanaerobaculia bacterium]|nr:DinB family protein [Thermoanaerobaculia bacterium]
PGKWSIRQIVAHLADGEVILGSRYRFVAAHDRPAIPGYDQDLFVERLGVGNATTEELLADFEMARAVNLGLLTRLPDEAFARVGVHAERGEESIDTMVAMYAGHDRVHLEQVETIRTGLFPPKKKKTGKKGATKSAPKAAARKAPAKPAAKAPKGKVPAKAQGKAQPRVPAKPATAKKAPKKK